MWEAAAYSQNVFKVMLDPASWVMAAICVFALKSRPVFLRLISALAANAIFILVWLVWPAGDSGRPYAWIAFAYELAATAIWTGLFLVARGMFRGAR